MNPWTILGIEPNSDKRVIKKAYARKLKVTRPEEQPKEFQVLHSAYKMAMQIYSQKQHAEALPTTNTLEEQESLDQPACQDGDGINDVSTKQAEQTTNSEALLESQIELEQNITEEENSDSDERLREQAAYQHEVSLRNAAIENILKQVDQILTEGKQLNAPNTWKFIENTNFLLENEFNWQLSIEIFKRLAEFNGKVKRNRRGYSNRINGYTLSYLDNLFNWQNNQYWIAQSVGEQQSQYIYSYLHKFIEAGHSPDFAIKGGEFIHHEKKRLVIRQSQGIEYGNMFTRVLALLIDCLPITLTFYLIIAYVYAPIFDVSDHKALAHAIIFTSPSYFILSMLCEPSKWQATPGKYLLKLRVTNHQFSRISHTHCFFRFCSFMLFSALGKISWIINCFMGGNLLHDRLSRTYVINIKNHME